MSLQACETALETKLLELADLPPIAWENVEFTPETGSTYLRITHLRNDPKALYLSGSDSRLMGIMQVDVFGLEREGRVPSLLIAERISEHFAPTQVLDAGNHRVDLDDPATIKSGMPDDGWYIVPIRIPWQAYPI